jgi:hypothetical protein
VIRFALTSLETAACFGAAWLSTKYGILIGGEAAMLVAMFAYCEASFGWGRK